MNLVRCSHGHFYDGDTNAACPLCGEENGTRATDGNESVLNEGRNNGAVYEASDVNKIKEEAPYIFVSYSHSDSEEVIGIIRFLKDNHFNVWYDEGIKTGYEWADEISRRIKHCKQFVCFVSRNSILSESVKDEIHIAWKYNINTIVVYLEKVELDGGLEMKLDRKQAISKYISDERTFLKKLSSSITQDVVMLKTGTPTDKSGMPERYEIIRKLSKGGTATTYLAKHKATGVSVLLKCGTYDHTVSGERIRRSFEQERKTLSKNISPFLPALYDYYEDAQNIYIAESYIEGTPMSRMTDAPLCEKVKMFIRTAKVLKELHRNGIYHCDIKPEHILVNHHGCFLIDFGSSEDENTVGVDDFKMGTVAYAAPEQFASYNGQNDVFGMYSDTTPYQETEKTIDERTDIYALGRVMVKVISGMEEEENSVTEVVTSALFADVSKTIGEFCENPLLQAIIEKMIREKKKNRYRNMDEVIRVLEDFLRIYQA